MEDITKLDLYALLGIPFDCSFKDIKTAYRKKALKCHPDKNPDNANAAQIFHQLSQALEILTDVAAKEAYDKILKARNAAKIRNQQLDWKRKKFKEDLEKRERDAEQDQEDISPVDVAKKLQAEIDRLRREGSRQLEEEIEAMKSYMAAKKETLSAQCTEMNQADGDDEDGNFPRLKVQWKHLNDKDGEYNASCLMSLFQKYGTVTALVVSSRRRAVVEFADFDVAVKFGCHDIPSTTTSGHCFFYNAFVYALQEKVLQKEKGFLHNPLKISWIHKPDNSKGPLNASTTEAKNENMPLQDLRSDRDYENIVMMRLRQAEERKRHIELIQDDVDDVSINVAYL